MIFKPYENGNESNPLQLNDNQLPKDCYPKDQLTPSELLPGDANSKWSQVNPSGQGDLADQNFLVWISYRCQHCWSNIKKC